MGIRTSRDGWRRRAWTTGPHRHRHVLTLFLTGHHSEARDCKPPCPTATTHFMDEAAASQQQQQQLMYQSQQQMATMEMEGCTTTSAPVAWRHGATVGAGNSLIRQSSSPAGFLTNGATRRVRTSGVAMA